MYDVLSWEGRVYVRWVDPQSTTIYTDRHEGRFATKEEAKEYAAKIADEVWEEYNAD